jgi:hypothetical protein
VARSGPEAFKRLVVTVIAFADHDGHDAATWADLHHAQWTSAWTARELTGLGDHGAERDPGHGLSFR